MSNEKLARGLVSLAHTWAYTCVHGLVRCQAGEVRGKPSLLGFEAATERAALAAAVCCHRGARLHTGELQRLITFHLSLVQKKFTQGAQAFKKGVLRLF